MRCLCSIFLICCLVACGGTKKVTQKKESAPTQPGIHKDSVSNSDTEVKNAPVDIEVQEEKTPSEVNNDSIYIIKITTHDAWDNLLKLHVTPKGNVNYKGFKKDHRKLNDYIRHLGENMPTKDWLKHHELAYWINAYNAFTIDLILRHYPVKSIKDIKDPWKQRHWKLGDVWYNLDEIEHQILRKMDEPRIHFAINCASVSCPKLQNTAFSSTNLDQQLTKATKDFLSDTTKNQISEDQIELSKLFQWFAKDFKKYGSLIDFLNRYSDVQISEKAKKRFMDYNWGLNE
ncbi:DUF547 domain-containing protein [Seonamhaeicola sp.]|uniref:DUF547 domain-containing protein n=1 Tax=Seonamhaeicola sp. TaxID=1912245 RepID=UPI0026168F3D|nr:DUF547 domain-containing protein [Seonamhaeicola sp.]